MLSSLANDSFRQPSAAWQILAAAFLPGVLAGVQMAGLLFFLNPELPFATVPLVKAVLIYGSLWGLVSAAVLLPFTWGRLDLAKRILPWSIVVVLAVSAFVDWFHASHLSFYLPPGINDRMIKAAVALSVSALVGFYTALLHSLHRRPYGIRSRLLMGFLVLASVYVMVERREAFRPLAQATPRPSSVERQPRPTLWVIGIGGATLDALLPLTQEGRLPFFASLLEQGAYGRLSSYGPLRDGALWTSLMTGKLPFRHGVLDDRTYDASMLDGDSRLRLAPVGVEFTHWGLLGARSRPVDARSPGVLTAWQVLGRLGVRYGLIGWPLTRPAPAEAEFVFSDRFFAGDFGRSSARPKELAERGILFRPEPEEIEANRNGLSEVARSALVQDAWRESLTSFLLDQGRDAEAFFLYLPGLEAASRAFFGAYYAVHFEGMQRTEAQEASEQLVAYYEHLDSYLAGLVGRIREPRIVAIVSPYGYEATAGWRRLLSKALEESAWQGKAGSSPDGVLLLSGGGVQPGAFLSTAELTDVLPTLLYAMGLPIARDLDGRVLTAAFSSSFLATQPLTFVPSYETMAELEPDEPVDLVTPEPPS